MTTLSPAYLAQKMPRVLIVEDDQTQRAMWVRLIGVISPNAELFWAASYAEAAEILDTKRSAIEHLDLLISDVFLEGAPTGFDICKDYFHRFHGQVILVSSFGEVELPKNNINHFKRTEPIYLRKPLDLRETVSVLRKLMSPHV